MIYIKQFSHGLIWIFYNWFVTNVPIWTIRKILYILGGLKIKSGSRIGIGTVVIHPWKITIGRNSVINENCYIDGRGGLTIGNNVSISIYSRILTASHKVDSDSFEYYKSGVTIKDNVWIGLNACILEGSILSKGCVIGAASVFKGISKKNMIYIGNPIQEHRERLISDGFKQKEISFFK